MGFGRIRRLRALDDLAGYAALREYFLRHVVVADSFGCGLVLEAPTWRASRDWGDRLGYRLLNFANATLVTASAVQRTMR